MIRLQKATTYAKALASIPLCALYWGGWVIAACVMGPIEEARKDVACGGPAPGGGRLPARGGWSPRPSIYRPDAYAGCEER